MNWREYRDTDWAWLEPLAERQGELDALRLILQMKSRGIWVIEPYTVGVICDDAHGAVLAGLCDRTGIKHMIRLARILCTEADNQGIELHTHVSRGTWKAKLFQSLGFREEAGLLKRPGKGGRLCA